MKHTKKLTVIVDGDVLLYRAAFRSMKNAETVGVAFDDVYNKIKEDIGDANYELHISGRGNFRKKINQQLTIDRVEYKGKRKERPKEYYKTREYVYNNYKPITIDGYEADDTAAMRATELYKNGDFFMVATIDKDWKQFPGVYYNTQYGSLSAMTSDDRIKFLHTQFLMGDAVDNVPGIYKIGPKTSDKLLKGLSPTQQFQKVIDTYKQYHPDDYLRRLDVMGVMLYLVRDKKDPVWNVNFWMKKLEDYEQKNQSFI